MRFLSRFLAVLAALGTCSLASAADPARAIPYSGRLEIDGNAPSAAFGMRFALYDAASGGNKLFEETQTVAVTSGAFSVVLGARPGTPLPDPVFTAGSLFVEVTVDATTLTPRQQVYAAPQAVRGRTADTFTVTGRLGVGTSSPAETLHVVGNQRNEGKLLVSGNVGIGTTTPAQALHVVGRVRSEGSLELINPLKPAGTASNWTFHNFEDGAFGGPSLQLWNYDVNGCSSGGMCQRRLVLTDDGRLGVGLYPDGGAKLQTSGGIYVEEAGNEGPNLSLRNSSKTGPTEVKTWTLYHMKGYGTPGIQFWGYKNNGDMLTPLIVADDGRVVVYNLVQTSSRDHKENIRDLSAEDAFSLLSELRPVRFRFKPSHGGGSHLGFIAEETPDDLQSSDGKGILPTEMISVLAKIGQAQQAELKRLR
ncbi:MAG TPA: hypothetical protein DFS52_16075 [Myxococcales bacterium]|jgi:hypothetical protein|nr:hypothetical protein [Myxococcales bacterium]